MDETPSVMKVQCDTTHTQSKRCDSKDHYDNRRWVPNAKKQGLVKFRAKEPHNLDTILDYYVNEVDTCIQKLNVATTSSV